MILAFIVGLLIAYALVLPVVIHYLVEIYWPAGQFGGPIQGIEVRWSFDEYVTIATWTVVLPGLAFQMLALSGRPGPARAPGPGSTEDEHPGGPR